MLSNSKLKSIDDFYKYHNQVKEKIKETENVITVCCGTGCQASGSVEVLEALKEKIKTENIGVKVKPIVKSTGCHGFCSRGPLVILYPEGIYYQQVKLKDVEEIVEKTVKQGELINNLLYKDPLQKEKVSKAEEIPFYARQTRRVLQNIGEIDPFEIDEAIAHGSYQALVKALTSMSPQEVIEEVKKSGLRGLGGAGFPTGLKWQYCSSYPGEKYVICNADEGDPGAFMDRSLLEGDPHRVLEGMLLAAYAIGAKEGYIYIRFEYPLAVKTLHTAIAQARSLGLLGDNILGTDFSFDIKISTGAGAFVCGESTALMASLEGKVGRPRAKYIRSVEKGFRNSPSNLNNVETYANVPSIILKGWEWFAELGTEKSKGTKIFALTGSVNNVGLVEVPMGTSLRTIIYDIGGGTPKNREFKAVQTGGPSGGCIPKEYLDEPVDFERLTSLGSIMGSGGMIVMDQTNCMVDVARYFVHFLVEESCGQCTPCREGLVQMEEILNRITQGEGRLEDIDKLKDLGEVVGGFSLCGLGKSAPNPVLSTLKYFKHEYLEHIEEGFCRSGVCKKLFNFEIDPDKCTGCGLCKRKCPAEAISGEKKSPHKIEQNLCIKCGECYRNCNFDSIKPVPIKK
ncbi:MAG: NADH dehydrogenase (Quinone) [Desulfonauticus sp. 38_4375]|nr:MAG: NADH dehydrogenase (Quinone) [Desulfonauticus sp. 38_4375]